MNTILLDLLAFGSVLSGILVITSRNPIISVLFLISVFVNVACYLILLGISFIGLTYVIIYVGAVAILFLFIVIMINVKLVEIQSHRVDTSNSYPLAFIISTIFLMSILDLSAISMYSYVFQSFDFLNFGVPINEKEQLFQSGKNLLSTIFGSIFWDNNSFSLNQIESLGNMLYTSHSMWILILSVVLLLAMIGAIVLCANPRSSKGVK